MTTDMPDAGPPPDNQKHLMTSDLTFPVVGIGASAGGIEALKVFFENMPRVYTSTESETS